MNFSNLLQDHKKDFQAAIDRLLARPAQTAIVVILFGLVLALPIIAQHVITQAQTIAPAMEKNKQITLFLVPDLDERRAKTLAKEIVGWPEIANTNFQSSQQSLDEFAKLMNMQQTLEALPSNPLPALIIVQPQAHFDAMELNSLKAKLDKLAWVEFASLDRAWVERLIAITNLAQQSVWILSTVLGMLVLFVLFHTLHALVAKRQNEIEVLAFVGATPSLMRRPFLYVGMLFGLLGAITAFMITGIIFALLGSNIETLIASYGVGEGFNASWLSGQLLLLIPISATLGGSCAFFAAQHYFSQMQLRV